MCREDFFGRSVHICLRIEVSYPDVEDCVFPVLVESPCETSRKKKNDNVSFSSVYLYGSSILPYSTVVRDISFTLCIQHCYFFDFEFCLVRVWRPFLASRGNPHVIYLWNIEWKFSYLDINTVPEIQILASCTSYQTNIFCIVRTNYMHDT